jgi:hypothetical protein
MRRKLFYICLYTIILLIIVIYYLQKYETEKESPKYKSK